MMATSISRSLKHKDVVLLFHLEKIVKSQEIMIMMLINLKKAVKGH